MADTRLKVRLSSDRLEARVDVRAGDPGGEDTIRAALAEAGVVYGIDDDAVRALGERIVEGDVTDSGVPLARGRPPFNGDDGELVMRFALGLVAGKEREDGSLDFFDRCLLQPVVEGELVATYRPPKVGTPGVGVDGNERRARDGRDRMPRLGDGVVLDDSCEIRAKVGGVVNEVHGRLLDVVTKHEHRGDVDLRSGHLATAGSVSVTGGVQLRFHVRASAGVEIRGDVDGGSVFAGGNLSVGLGVVGNPDSRIAAEGDVSARFLQGATIDCGGELRVGHHVVNSTLRAAAATIGGRVIGGETIVTISVSARELGCNRGQATVIKAGELRIEPISLEPKAAKKKVRRAPRTSRATRNRPKTRDELRESRRLRIQRVAAAKAAFVDADLVHPGVTVHIGGQFRTVDETMRHVRFYYDAEREAVGIVSRQPQEEAAEEAA